MYTVACSACGHTEKSPFARVGAVVVCASCSAQVQLRPEDLKRQFKLRTDLDDELFRVPQVQRTEEPAMEAAALAPVPGAQELDAALHEDHAELAAEAERRAEAARRRKPKGQPALVPGMSGADLAQHLAKKRKMKTAALLVGGGLAALIAIIAVIAASSGNGDADPGKLAVNDGGKSADGGATDKAVTPDGTGNPDKDKAGSTKDRAVTPVTPKDGGKVNPVPPPATVRVVAMPLGIDQWQPINEAYRSAPLDGSVLLVNEVSEKQDSGAHVFRADVVSQGIASALVSVTLVNDEDRVYAKFERPFYLLDGKRPRPMKLVIPADLMGSSTSVYWSVHPIDAHVKNLTLMEDTLAQVLPEESKRVLRVSAYNPSSRTMSDAAFVIQAIDEQGQIMGQWRLKYPHEVVGKSWVKFEAELPGPALAGVNWRVLGAGIAASEAVAPKPPPVSPSDPDPPVQPRRTRGLFDF